MAAGHPTLLTPGPIEVDNAVLDAMRECLSDADFTRIFAETLQMLRQLLQTSNSSSQPFVVGGSGSLGFDQVAANVLQPGDEVLVLNVGYWGEAFAECLKTYGVRVEQLIPPLGAQVPLPEIGEKLQSKRYKAITVTHVDTVTGVLSDIQSISELVRKESPDTLVVVDGVCSIGSEDIRFDEWHLDIVLGASQKALGAPAGLSIVMASKRVIEVFQRRQTPVRGYYASWHHWLPIMRDVERGKQTSSLAGPSSHLIFALHVSLTGILGKPIGFRWEQHKEASQKVKSYISSLGLAQISTRPEDQANSMTAFWLPAGVRSENILPLLARKGVMLARGPQKEIAGQYIRFAHMGVSATDATRQDIAQGLQALREALLELRALPSEAGK